MLSETDPQLADVLRKQFPVWGARGIRVRHSSRLSPPLLFIEGSVSTPKDPGPSHGVWISIGKIEDVMPSRLTFCHTWYLSVQLICICFYCECYFCIVYLSLVLGPEHLIKDQFSFPPLENKTFLSPYPKMSACYSVVLIAPPAPPSSFHLHEIFTVWSHFMYWNITWVSYNDA